MDIINLMLQGKMYSEVLFYRTNKGGLCFGIWTPGDNVWEGETSRSGMSWTQPTSFRMSSGTRDEERYTSYTSHASTDKS